MRSAMSPRVGWWVFAAGLVVAGFWPLATVEFGQHNDYSRWSYDAVAPVFGFPEGPHLVAIGRPLGAVLLNLHFFPIRSIVDFTVSRRIALAATLACAWLLGRFLERRAQLPAGFAACASACVFLLPSSQLYVSWVTNFVPGTLTVLLALAIYQLLERIELADLRARLGWARHLWRLLLAGSLFLAAMWIYPPTALFLLVPTFALVVFSPLDAWPQTRQRVLRDFGFAVGGIGSYFVLTRFVVLPLLAALVPAVQRAVARNQTGIYQLHASIDPAQWLANFEKVLAVAIGGCLHPLVSDRAATWAAVAFVLVLIAAAAVQSVRGSSGSPRPGWQRWKYGSEACLAGLALVAIAECPVVLAAGNTTGFALYRVVFPAAAMFLLFCFSLIWRAITAPKPLLPNFVFRPLPALMLVGCALLAGIHLHRSTAYAHAEVARFRQQLSQLDLQAADGLLVLCRRDESRVASGLKMEFADSATGSPFVEGFVHALLAERGIRPGQMVVGHCSPGPETEYLVTASRAMAVIDMNEPEGDGTGWRLKLPRAVATALGERKHRAALNAFDGDPGSGWEASGRQKQWIEVTYDRPYAVAEYAITADPITQRMPRDWQLWGSHDGRIWEELDRRQGEDDWHAGQQRTFQLEQPARFLKYWLIITAGHDDVMRIDELVFRHPTPLFAPAGRDRPRR